MIRHFLTLSDYKHKDKKLLHYDRTIVFPYSEEVLSQDLLAH